MREEDKELYRASIKSADTEEKLDMWFYRPLGFRCALFFRNRGIHPNVITIISILEYVWFKTDSMVLATVFSLL